MGISIFPTPINDLTYDIRVISSDALQSYSVHDIYWSVSSLSTVVVTVGDVEINSDILVPIPTNSIASISAFTEYGGVSVGYVEDDLYSTYYSTSGVFYDYANNPNSILFNEPYTVSITVCAESGEGPKVRNTSNELLGTVTTTNGTDYSLSGFVNSDTKYYQISYDTLSADGFYISSDEVPAGIFFTMTGSNIVSNYILNYGNYSLNTISDPITSSYIRITLADYDTRFYISAYNTAGDVDSVIIDPTPGELIEIDSSPEFATLSAIKGNDSMAKYVPSLIWEVSDPLSATLLKDGLSTIYIDTSVTIPQAVSDYITFTSPSVTAVNYTISAYSAGNKAAIYEFNYDPIVSEGLVIQVPATIDSFNSPFILKRNILGQSGFIYTDYPITQISTVAWGIAPSDPGAIIGFTGLSGQDIVFPYTTVDDFNITGYGDPLTFHQELTTGVIESIAQLATATPGDPATTYVSAYNNTIGGDIIQLSANQNVVNSYTLCAYYFDNPNISAVYTYIPLFPTEAIQISALSFDDTIEIKPYNLLGINPYQGQIASINPGDIILWTASSVDDPNLDNLWVTYPNGIPYTLDTPNLASEIDNLVFYISSGKTTAAPQPSVYTITLSSDLFSDNYNITAYEFLADSVFDLQIKINNENPRDVNNSMWRLTDNSYRVSAIDLSYIPDTAIGYTRYWSWGDGTVSAVGTPTVYHTYYNVSDPTTMNIRFTAADVLKMGANNAVVHFTKVAEDYMDLTFVDNFPSTDFIAYPSLVFPESDPDNPVDLSSATYTQTQGVCSYGEGHTVIFNLSAREESSTSIGGVDYTNTFKWTYGPVTKTNVGNNTNTGTTFETVSSNSFNPAGTAISLSVFNDIFPTTMVSAHTADNGLIESYPNFNGISDDNSKYTQNIRIFPYESPSAVITTYSDGFIIQEGNFLASEILSLPEFSPVNFVSRICNWSVSNGVWTDITSTTSNDDNSASLNYELTRGEVSLPGTLAEGQIHLLTIGLSGTATERIYSYDFEESDKSFAATSVQISAYVMPEILIYTDNNFILTGGDVIFENVTNQAPSGLISAWVYDPGDGSIYTKYDFSPLEITYPEPGAYTLNVSAIAFNGYIETRSFPGITTALDKYEGYRSDIFRTYNVSDFKLPYSCSKNILLPPNEWVVSDNINAAFNRLNTNLNYISAVSKIYQSPPTSYIGWFGTSATETDANWHVNIVGLSAGVNDGYLTASDTELIKLNDIAVGTEKLYLANDTKIQILSADYSGTLIAETSTRAVGDPFANVHSIDIDSDDNIYVLDNLRNMINVLEYRAGSSNPWKLLHTWGGYGGAIAKTKFRNPSDLYVDTDNFVWIVDKDNLVIKKYSKTGGWVTTIESDLFKETNKPISITKDLDSNLHVLTKDYVVKLEEDGTFITTYDYFNDSNANPVRIIHHINDGFIYICSTDKIVRVQKNGTAAGVFANNGSKYNGIYQDTNQDIFVTSDHAVLKYNEQILILDAMIDISDYLWDIEDIYIDDDEYVADWVYNKSLLRMWDNIDILRRSLKGKINVETNEATDQTIISIRNFSVSEYNDLISLTPKSEIYIGINEFVTADVINRNLKLLCGMLEDILNSID